MSPLGGAVVNADTRSAGATASCGMPWYVLQTQRHREAVAQGILAERNVRSYLPLMVLWPRPVVGSAIAPMFPGYLFVQAALTDDFSRIAWTPGVKEFVRFGMEPASVEDSVIAFLHRREGADGLIRCQEGVREGTEVCITHGPFRGLTAIVEQRLPARERICVLMNLLRRETRVQLPENWVRRA
jgi:transcription antitermination factor NusG